MGAAASVQSPSRDDGSGSTLKKEFMVTLKNDPIPAFLRQNFIFRLALESVEIVDLKTHELISSIIYVDIDSWSSSLNEFSLKVNQHVMPTNQHIMMHCRAYGKEIAANIFTCITKLMKDMETRGYTKEKFRILKPQLFLPASKLLQVCARFQILKYLYFT